MKKAMSFENFIELYNWIVSAREMIISEDDTNKNWIQKLKDTEISKWEYQYVKDATNNPDIDYPLKYTIYDLDSNDHNHTNENYIYYGDPKEDTIIHIYLDDKAEWTPNIRPIKIQFRDSIPFSDVTPINVIIISKNVFTLNIPNGDNTIETLYNLKEYYTDFFTDMILTNRWNTIATIDILSETLANIFLHRNIIDYDIDKVYEYITKKLEKQCGTINPYTYKAIFELSTITDFVTYINNTIVSIQNKYYTKNDINKLKYLYLDYLDEYKYKYKSFRVHNITVDKALLESKTDEKEKVDGDKDVSVSV